MKLNIELSLEDDKDLNERELSLATGIAAQLLAVERGIVLLPEEVRNEVMRLYNAARRNRDKGNKRKNLYAGRCEGIAMTLSEFGYRIVIQRGTCVALPKAECDAETFG